MKGRALVAWNLRRLRVTQGLSQEKLAADAEVDRSYLGRLEREQENPTVDLLDRISTALAVQISELLRQPTSSKRPKPLPAGRRPSKSRTVK
jgi:transcriptional regulator with XRE-family HTH domain